MICTWYICRWSVHDISVHDLSARRVVHFNMFTEAWPRSHSLHPFRYVSMRVRNGGTAFFFLAGTICYFGPEQYSTHPHPAKNVRKSCAVQIKPGQHNLDLVGRSYKVLVQDVVGLKSGGGGSQVEMREHHHRHHHQAFLFMWGQDEVRYVDHTGIYQGSTCPGVSTSWST